MLSPFEGSLPFGLLRRRDVPARTDRQSVRPESVTYVSGGMKCHAVSTHVSGMDLEELAPQAGLEPATLRLTDWPTERV
jgi:hypothetical protein